MGRGTQSKASEILRREMNLWHQAGSMLNTISTRFVVREENRGQHLEQMSDWLFRGQCGMHKIQTV